MRKGILRSAVLGMAIGAMLIGSAFAEDVYVTQYGKKYHKAESRFIKGKEVTKLTREDAEAQGYEPSQDFLRQESDAADQAAEQPGS